MVREAWTMTLNQDQRFRVVAECGNAESAYEPIRYLKPDIILLDINLSGINGIEAVPVILQQSPSSKIIGVSLHSLPAYARKMMQLGARGYITKNSCRDEMIEAILTVHRGEKFLCRQVKEIIAEEFTTDEQNKINTLSKRELEVIQLIKRGMSSKEIAAELCVAVKTIEVHRYNILRKLNLKNSAALVNFISKYEFDV